MIWNKFKAQFITIITSIVLIALIFGIYEDLYKILEISGTQSVLWLLLLKWFLISLILLYNWYQFSKLRSQDIPISSESEQHQNILDKKKLKTKTDVILKKYIHD